MPLSKADSSAVRINDNKAI